MTAERRTDARFGEAEAVIPFRLRRDIAITETPDPDIGGMKFYVKLLANGEVFEFGEEELFICQSLDGDITPSELRGAFEARFGIQLSERKLLEFIAELRAMNLLVAVGDGPASAGSPPPRGAAMFDDVGARNRQSRYEEDDRFPPQADRAIPHHQKAKGGFQVRLFDVEGIVRGLAWLLRPIRYLSWLLIPLVFIAVLTLFHRVDDFVYDVNTAWGHLAIVPRLLAGLFIIGLACNLTQGAVATAFGARIRDIKIAFIFGFIPRFALDLSPVAELPRRGRVWTHGTPLLVRLAVFSICTIFWASYRASGTWFPDFALLLAELALLEFFIDAMPFFPTHGYFWISNYLGSPMYGVTAFKFVGMKLTGRRIPENLTLLRQWGLGLFAVAVVIYTGLLVVPLMLVMAVFLEARLSGTGVVIFLVFFSLLVMWFAVCGRAMARLRRTGAAPNDDRAVVPSGSQPASVVPIRKDLPVRRGQSLPDFQRDLDIYARRRQRSQMLPRLLWLTALAVIAYVAFLPYPYEAGGEFTVLPTTRVEVHTRTDGEVLKVLAQEGQWVEENQILAIISDWNEERNVAVTAANLDKSRAKLRVLEEGSKPEEIELARKQVESARARVTFADLQAKRAEILIKEGHISQAQADQAFSEVVTRRSDLAVAEANLQVVRSGATASEIEALRAEVRGLEEQLAFYKDQLERTKVRTPATGRIVTPDLQFMQGKYLPIGTLFAAVEDNRVSQVEIAVPETDIGQVEVGKTVRIKAWQESEIEIPGRVIEIAPVATKQDYGKVIRVKTIVPNPDGVLRSGMTGYAKIEGSWMPVWEAFTRWLIRFFRIEFWSWIP